MNDSLALKISEAVLSEDIATIESIASERTLVPFSDLGSWLILAASEGKERSARCLLVLGADPNYQNADGESPLSFAAANNRFPVAKLLVDFGADVNLKDRSNATPSDWAKYHASQEFRDWLADVGGLLSQES